jgi:hypothetical protein
MKYSIIITALAILGFSSCKKDLGNEPVPSPNTQSTLVKNFKQLKVDDQFSFNTSNEITLNVSPMKTSIRIVNTLRVSSTDGKTIYLSRLASMDEALTEKLIIPSTEKSLTVSFGSISKTFNTTATFIEFDYLSDNLTEE